MKRIVAAALALALTCSSEALFANEEISDHAKNVDELYREGTGAVDGAYTATSVSMLGWGIGLAAGIAILAACLHQSKGAVSHN